VFRNMVIFYDEELLAPRPTPKLEDHPLSAVRYFLFNVFAATFQIHRPFLHPQPEDVPCRCARDTLVMAGVTLTEKKYQNFLVDFLFSLIIYLNILVI
jgi:hypothetical protein